MVSSGVDGMRFVRYAVFCVGIPISAALMLLGTAIATAADLSSAAYAVLGAGALIAGGFCSGLCCCRKKRTGGIVNGMLCGAAVTGFWYVLAWSINGGAGISPVMLCGVLGGVCGGVKGVNLPAAVPKQKTHRGLHLRQSIRGVQENYQKKRYYRPWKEPEKSTSEE